MGESVVGHQSRVGDMGGQWWDIRRGRWDIRGWWWDIRGGGGTSEVGHGDIRDGGWTLVVVVGHWGSVVGHQG